MPVFTRSTVGSRRERVVGDGGPPIKPSDRSAATSIDAVGCAERRYVVETYACTIDALRALAAALRAVKGGMSLCRRPIPDAWRNIPARPSNKSRSAGLGAAIIWLRHRRIARSPGDARGCVGLMAERLGRHAHRDGQVSLGLAGCHPNLSASWSINRRGSGKDDLGPTAADRLRIAAGRHPGGRDNAAAPPASRYAGHRRMASEDYNESDTACQCSRSGQRHMQKHTQSSPAACSSSYLALNCTSQEKMVPRRGVCRGG